MRQDLTTDTVERYIDAPPQVLYGILSDVTRTPERTADVARCEWLDGATGPAKGARFKSVNVPAGRGPKWSNKSVVVAATPGEEFSFARTEPFGGTVEWRHRLVAEDTGTRASESYEVTKRISIVGWFIIGTLYGMKDRKTDLHVSMVESLDQLAALAAADQAASR